MEKVLVALLVAGVFAGVEHFPYDLKLEWEFPDQETVDFFLHVPKVVVDTFGWCGVGFKLGDEEDLTMAHSDLFTLRIQSNLLDDRIGLGNITPPHDYKKGCENNLELDDNYSMDGDTRIYKFSRKLDTEDECDIPLKQGDAFIMMWAVGQLYQGDCIAHTHYNRGREFGWLTEDYVDDGSDDYLGDGGYVQTN